MGQGTQKPCNKCGKPAYGDTCRPCVNRHRTFANGSASGYASNTVAPTVGPWWIGAPQDGFTHIGEQHAERMSRGCAASFIRADAFLAWTL